MKGRDFSNVNGRLDPALRLRDPVRTVRTYWITTLLKFSACMRTVVSAKKDKHLHIIPGFSNVRVCDLPDGVVCGRIDSLFSRLLHRMAKESILRAAAVVINTFQGLESTVLNDLRLKIPHKHYLPLGPISHLCPRHHPPRQQQHPHAACFAFLDRFPPSPSSSVVYIGFGIVKTPPPDELKALAEGLEESGVPFLWSLKEKAIEDGLPEGFLERTKERGLVVPWAPQVMVLEQGAVGAFVTHCGWNSVLEGIAAGVPMIGRPMLGDQWLNGRMVSHVWEIGVMLKGGVITKEGVLGSIDVMFRTEGGKKMREKISKLKEVAKESVRDSGSSMASFNALLGGLVPN